MSRPFRHRIAFGAWINDMRSAAMPNEEWPCPWFDDQIEGDLLETMRLQAASGFNVFDVFGMFASYSWPVDIVSCVAGDRRARARRIIDAAHELGLKIIHGTGVYSWGFDEIVKADANVRGPNPHALCGSREESWEWMKKVLDFVLENFDLDGFHLEASDLGRCTCPSCSRWGDVEYYSILNARAADYIRSKAPDKLLLVNMCGYLPWGDRMPPTEYRHLVELSRHIDVLIDPGNLFQYFTDPGDWPELIRSLECDFGTSGNFWVYPPQQWERLRWFLPHARRTADHLAHLSGIGGNACEYYMGPIVNPGVEVNVAFGGRFLSDASAEPGAVLDQVVDELYRPRSQAVRRDVARVFLNAEEAYFESCRFDLLAASGHEVHELRPTDVQSHLPKIPEYLGVHVGQEIMNAAGRRRYAEKLSAILKDLPRLAGSCRDDGRIKRIETCIRGVLGDIDLVDGLAKE